MSIETSDPKRDEAQLVHLSETKKSEESEIEESNNEETDNDTNDANETDEETDEVSENDEDYLEDLSEVPGSELYVVTIDGIPRVYVDTAEEAYLKMWDMARTYCTKNTDRATRYLQIGKTALHIERQHNFIIFSYPEITYRLRYFKIRKISGGQQVEE